MLVLDLGSNVVAWRDTETGKSGVWKAEEMFRETLKLPQGSEIGGEAAHFSTPRTKVSKAQYYKEDELLYWYDALKNSGINLYLFAENETAKYRKFAARDSEFVEKHNIEVVKDKDGGLDLKKSEESDLLCLQWALDNISNIKRNLKRPPRTFDPSVSITEGNKARQEWGEHANWMRTFDYSHPDDKASAWLHENILELQKRLKQETREILKITDDNLYYRSSNNKEKKPKGSLKGQSAMLYKSKMRTPTITAVQQTLMDWDGNLRVRESTGQTAGWNWVKNEVFMCKPYRPKKKGQSGGVIRSNIYHWGLTPYTVEKLGTKKGNKKKKLIDFTPQEHADRKVIVKQYMKAIKDLWTTLKSMTTEQLQDSPSLQDSTSVQDSSSVQDSISVQDSMSVQE